MSERPRQVESDANPLVKDLRRLVREPLGYRRVGRVWLEGDHLARAYIARGGEPGVAVMTEAAWQQPLGREVAAAARDVVLLPERLLAACSTLESPAALGLLVPWQGATAAVQPDAPTVVLDRLQDPGNVGSVLRSAAALGVRQVLALRGTAGLWSPKVLRAGMGAHFGLHLVEGCDAAALDRLSVPLVATSSYAARLLPQATLPWPCAWVFGHEGQGVDPALAARCTQTVCIPQPGGEESLNVAAAAAICLYESARQRGLVDQ